MSSPQKDPAGHKAWANKIIWRQAHDSDKPHPTALRMAQEVMGEDYIPQNLFQIMIPWLNSDG